MVDYRVLDLAVATVHEFPAEKPSEIKAGFSVTGVPDWVVTRLDALKWLSQLMEKNKDMGALCYGFYRALSEQDAMLSGGAAVDTLKMSYSLSKLRTQSFASYVAGQQAHGDYTAARRARRAKGEYIGPQVRFSA